MSFKQYASYLPSLLFLLLEIGEKWAQAEFRTLPLMPIGSIK
jgi:hypothetical protein